MSKATHRGECQLCGRVQKLPGGKMAKHGYTKRWVQFVGTCPGSDFLPYELDRSLILIHAERAEGSAARLRASETETRAERGYVWVREERRGNRDNAFRTLHRWRRLNVGSAEADLKVGYLTTWTGEDGEKKHCHVYKDYNKNEDEITALNRVRAEEFGREAAKLEEYAAWARKRHADWELKELRPVEARR